jgi:hypothetical protein
MSRGGHNWIRRGTATERVVDAHWMTMFEWFEKYKPQ